MVEKKNMNGGQKDLSTILLEINGSLKGVQASIKALESRMGKLEVEVQNLRKDLGDERVNHAATRSKSNALDQQVQQILAHIPTCETRFQELEKRTSATSGKLYGIWLTINSAIALLALLATLFKIFKA